MGKVVSVKEYLMHKLVPREDVLSPVISKAMNTKGTPGDMGVVWGLPISTNLHSAKDSPSHTQISANAHKFFFFFLGINFDPECIWRHLNELQLVFHPNVPILKTITIRNAWSNANYSFEVPLYSLW